MNKIIQKLKHIFNLSKEEPESPGSDQSDQAPKSASQEIPTKPFEEKLPQASSQSQTTYLVAGYMQSTGRQRDHNEDALFSLTSMLAYNETVLPIGFYIVADGMGGHQHGEVASEVAIRALVDHVLNKLYIPFFSLHPHPADSSYQEILQQGVMAANKSILELANGGGTTITAVLIVGEQMTIAHVGDSRVYTVSDDGRLEALTRDHSLVKRLLELGQISPEEAAVHPQRNVLYRALGQGEAFEPELISAKLPTAGSLLLCSDGLWNVLSEQSISTLITESNSPQDACEKLVQAANQAGGPDNISTILVNLPG